MSKNTRRLVTLKPHDSHLADGVVELWLIFVRLCIVAIAFCDAIAWSYLGYVTASGIGAYAAALVSGVIAFILVGSLDATFVMHDSTARQVQPETEEEPTAHRGLRTIRRILRASHFAVIVRVLLVTLTFVVTAPALTMFFFSRDIDAAIAKRQEATDSVARQALEKKYDNQLTDARAQLGERNEALESEIAGTGKSRRYGEGRAANAIKNDIRRLESDLAALEREKVSQLQTFGDATPEERAKTFGVQLHREGPETRARVLAELEKSPAFRSMRSNIKAFLAFLFLTLLTLKLFQPRAVRYYYSEFYQTAYANYLAGAYNARLTPPSLQPDKEGMTPSQFVDWFNKHQRRLNEKQEIKDTVASAVEILQLQQQALETINTKSATTIVEMHEDLNAVLIAGAELEQRQKAARNNLDAVKSRIGNQQRELEDSRFDYKLTEGMSLRDQKRLLEMTSTHMTRRQQVERQLQSDRNVESELQAEINNLTQQLQANEGQRLRIMNAIETVGKQVQEVAERLRVIQRRMLDEIAPLE